MSSRELEVACPLFSDKSLQSVRYARGYDLLIHVFREPKLVRNPIRAKATNMHHGFKMPCSYDQVLAKETQCSTRQQQRILHIRTYQAHGAASLIGNVIPANLQSPVHMGAVRKALCCHMMVQQPSVSSRCVKRVPTVRGWATHSSSSRIFVLNIYAREWMDASISGLRSPVVTYVLNVRSQVAMYVLNVRSQVATYVFNVRS
jgi:hypothetical protein